MNWGLFGRQRGQNKPPIGDAIDLSLRKWSEMEIE
jgi:hypothetical protein